MENSVHKFEGSEKKLDIFFNQPMHKIRSNIGGCIDKMVRACGAQIISKVSTRYLDAYILSESSLFVWGNRLLIITCGKTTPIRSVPVILEFLKKSDLAFVLYERKNSIFPHEQPSSFGDDVTWISKFFIGESIRIGSAGKDHIHFFCSSVSGNQFDYKSTFQLQMHDLDPLAVGVFSSQNVTLPAQAVQFSNLYTIYPEMKTNSHLFSPSGYSLNGVFKKKYFAVHVTPQPLSSYASFETNVTENNYSVIIKRLVSIFKPKRFSIVLTTGTCLKHLKLHSDLTSCLGEMQFVENRMLQLECGLEITFASVSSGS